MIQKMLGIGEQETEEHWVSISDVMAGLMVIFLFIAISYMLKVNENVKEITRLNKDINKHLIDYKNLKVNLSQELSDKFGEKLQKNLTIRFKNPFEKNESIVPPEFKNVLNNFFPQYIKILEDYKEYVEEIRIEGHTSSVWKGESELEKFYSREDAVYLENMELSQNRARNVLKHVLRINHPQIALNKNWIKENLTANGLSSSQPIFNIDRTENEEESRRVEFRVVTKSENLIYEIMRILEGFNKAEVTN